MTTEIRPPAAHQRPSGRMYLSVNQLNLVDMTDTLVMLDAITAGFADGLEDVVNHKITPGVAGLYDVKGQVTLVNTIADKRFSVSVKLNGVSSKISAVGQASIASYLTINCHDHLYLSATDFLSLWALSYAGVDTVDIYGREPYTFLSVQRVR